MNLEHLKTFHQVAINKSFTKAAKTLFLTQPAVSQHIQAIEHAYKKKLFDRSKKQIVLTPEGQVLFGYTQQMFGIFNEIENAFQGLNELQSGHVEIAASAVVGTYYLPEILATYQRHYPNIEIHLRIANSEHVAQWIINREIDIGICARIVGKQNLVQYQLLNEPYRTVASPFSHWATLNRPLSVSEFVKASIVTREKGARSQSKLDAWIKQQGIDSFNSRFTVDSMSVAKHFAMNGLGVVTLPELTVKKEVEAEQLVYVDVDGFNLHTGYYLNYLKDVNLSPAALKMLMLLKENRRDFQAIL